MDRPAASPLASSVASPFGSSVASSLASSVASSALVPMVVLLLLLSNGVQCVTLEPMTQIPAISDISNIANYGWIPGLPCEQLSPGTVKCDTKGYVTALILPPASGAYLPESLGNLVQLTSLIVQNNSYSDMLPQSISKLKKLKILNLSGNLFSGSVPASISTLTNLVSLTLSRNLFTGPIPAGLQKLKTLTKLDLSNNYFSGVASFADCKKVDFSNNCLASPSTCTSKAKQRTPAVCLSSCNSLVWGSASAVCSGKGLCLPSGSQTAEVASDWACLCSSKNGPAGTFTCT